MLEILSKKIDHKRKKSKLELKLSKSREKHKNSILRARIIQKTDEELEHCLSKENQSRGRTYHNQIYTRMFDNKQTAHTREL